MKPWHWFAIGGGALVLIMLTKRGIEALPGGTSTTTPTGSLGNGVALTTAQCYALARSVGFPPDVARTMVAIAMRESALIPTARCKNCFPGVQEDSIGLWQINMIGSLGQARLQQFGISSPDELLNPVTNARAAFLTWGGSANNLNIAWRINEEGSYGYRTKYLANLAKLPSTDNMELAFAGGTGVNA